MFFGSKISKFWLVMSILSGGYQSLGDTKRNVKNLTKRMPLGQTLYVFMFFFYSFAYFSNISDFDVIGFAKKCPLLIFQ